MTYGASVWTLIKKLRNEKETKQISMKKFNFEVKRKDKIRLTNIKHRLKTNLNVINTAKKEKWNWARHISRKKEKN